MTRHHHKRTCLHVKCSLLCPILTEIGMNSHILVKTVKTKFLANPLGGIRAVLCSVMADRHRIHDAANNRFL